MGDNPDKSTNEPLPKQRYNPFRRMPEANLPTALAVNTTNKEISSNDLAILPTASITLIDKSITPVRALMDTGSQVNLITVHCVQRLGIPRMRCDLTLCGIGDTEAVVRGMIMADIGDANGLETGMFAKFIIVSRITGNHPVEPIATGILNQMKSCQLADPKFATSGKIDVLLGAGVVSQSLRSSTIIDHDGLRAQDTSLGWIIFGQLPQTGKTRQQMVLHVQPNGAEVRLDELLQKMWLLEDMPAPSKMSPLDIYCEKFYQKTHWRDETGRYVVKIPLNPGCQELGDSRKSAYRQFMMLESRLQRNSVLREKYVAFMREYEQMGHMRVATRPPKKNELSYYIPHHAILDKFRIVFNASFITSNGKSLNDLQLTGPRLQEDLSIIIIRFRMFKIGIVADIKKMFRMVRIDPDQYDLQRIFWRESPEHEVREYWLTVVTYGMTASGYLAVRSMKQCGQDNKIKYPIAARVIDDNFFIDDVLTGDDDESAADAKGAELSYSLGDGGFSLDKMTSNSERALSWAVDMSERSLNIEKCTSVLGLIWDPKTDEFKFKINISKIPDKLTKRLITSESAKIYDPNGYLAPVVMKAKVFIQKLWKEKLDWDDIVLGELRQNWLHYYQNLTKLSEVRVPRWLGTTKDTQIQLHVFADASMEAMAVALYVRVTNTKGEITTMLVMSKTKVAPVKTQTIPRLELCAAEMAARLVNRIKGSCEWDTVPIFYWTDSEIVLHWLKKLTCNLKVFVAKRVASIQDKTIVNQWFHVGSKENPSDVASRGASVDDLIASKLWWRGPSWLTKPEIEWPKDSLPKMTEEQKTVYAMEQLGHRIATVAIMTVMRGLHGTDLKNNPYSLIEKKATLGTILRVTAYVRRFVKIFIGKWGPERMRESKMDDSTPVGKLITATEREDALKFWVKVTQQTIYRKEISSLTKGELISPNSNLLSLAPFIDSNGILRVGGRLGRSELTFDEQHPIILPQNCTLTLRLIRDAHNRTLHGPIQMMMQFLRTRFWIVGLRRSVKTYNSRCVQCFRQLQRTAHQQMADLPSIRVTPARAFKNCGVDYAGPIQIKVRAGRCKTMTKGYVAIFICTVTKAVHLEAVSDLTTNAFLAAFHRMVGRRGMVTKMMSDNATNFVGAAKQLNEVLTLWQDEELTSTLRELGTSWQFITPAAPHHGGLWERAVRSMKHHLRRVMGDHIFTFEELSTLLVRVEACLNSRPLTALTTDHGDQLALTPGHFLIGEALLQPLAPDFSEIPSNRLRFWDQLKQMEQQFWQRWSQEYLVTLQQRRKWAGKVKNIKVGEVVLVKDELTPPTQWKMGRVIEVHAGQDGLVRSVTLKTATTELKRPVTKLCVLPIDGDNEPAVI